MLQAIRRTLRPAVPILLLACTPHGDPNHPTSTPPSPPAHAQPPPEPSHPEPALATPTPAPIAIGWPRDLREQPKAARERNAAALKLHRKGDYTGSLAGFDAALALAPDLLLARFNRACALSRLARTADAARELEMLLRIDLPAFGPRLDSDEDLANLRAAPEAAGLATLRAELTRAYAAAVARGVPALLYGVHQVLSDGGGGGNFGFDHRAGVWLPDTAVFVPVTPERASSFGLVWSSDAATVTVLSGPLTSMYYQFYPLSLAVDVYSLTAPGTLLRANADVEASFRKLYPKLYAADDIDFDFRLVTIGVRPLAGATQLETIPHAGPGKRIRIELGPAATTIAETPHEGSWRHDVRVREGNVIAGVPAGYSLTKSALTVPGRAAPIGLGKLLPWTQVIAAADNSAAFVLTVDANCRQRHRLLRLDLQTFELRELSRGAVAGTILPGLDGALYLQLGATTRRLAPDGTLSDAGLPAWLKLAYPIADSDCYM